LTWVHRIKILSMDSVPILLLVGLRRETLVKHVVVGSVQLDLRPAIGAGGMPIILSPVTSWGWRTIVLAVMMGIAWVGLPTPCRGHHHSIPAPVISKTVLVHIPMCLGTNSMVLSTKVKVLKHTHKVKAH